MLQKTAIIKRFIRQLFDLKSTQEEENKTFLEIKEGVEFKGKNLWLLAFAIFIACIGLNINSKSAVIGAMILSPVMGPIFGIGFSLGVSNSDLFKTSLKNAFRIVLVSVFFSTLYYLINPYSIETEELISFSKPTFFDVLLAFIGGLAAMLAISRESGTQVIIAVAVATSCIPPLCTAGFGLAALDFKFFIGAMYLYCINCFFIGIATFVIIKYLKFKPVVTENKSFDKKLRYIITILVFLMVIPSFYLAYNLLNEKKFSQNVNNYIKTEFTDKGYTLIYQKISYNASPKTIDLAFLTKKFDSIEIDKLNKDLIVYGLNNTKVNIRQSTQDMKSEILSELSKQNTNLSEKDIQINLLSTELKQYKFDDPELVQEVKVLFPEITEISFGKINNYFSKDSTFQSTVVIYKVDKKIDAPKLMQWLQLKFSDNNVQLIAN